jgi:hypothetical protein
MDALWKLLARMGLVDTRPIAEWESMVMAEIERCARLLPVQERACFKAREEGIWADLVASECYRFYAQHDDAIYAQLSASRIIDKLRLKYPPWVTSHTIGFRSTGNVKPKHDHEE